MRNRYKYWYSTNNTRKSRPRNDYNTMSLFSKGYGNYEIEQLFNAFGWPRWANDFDTWAGDENYQAWLNASGNLINSRLFYDAMVALGDPEVRYWSALNTGNDDFAYAFTR